ncbi:3-deoxy-D-manno-octulosonic acid kinase [Thalassotalea maritima]|uniref:3-deoxy-D-manno-octulosonic acid kinase n=1 Tax=Thalassotalea maritima TaxID=3242416 RepID=UPI003528A0AB
MNLGRFVKHSQIKLLQQGKLRCLFDADVLDDFCVDMFDAKYWQQRDAILGSSTGRGTAWFVQHHACNMVLRHYYRGGLIGRLIDDNYLYLGLNNTRAVKEFLLLAQMRDLGLPAPKPLAVKIDVRGLSYQADILIELIAGATDLVGLLSKAPLNQQVWHNIGACIRQFHDHNVYHHDLNAHNIMLDDSQKVWLIDFDQGRFMSKPGKWQQQNLARLQRSFLKEQKKLPEFHFNENNWQSLQAGYYR